MREIHGNLQTTQEKLEVKSQELNEVKERLEVTERSGADPREMERQLEKLDTELTETREQLRVTKEELDTVQRQGGGISKEVCGEGDK